MAQAIVFLPTNKVSTVVEDDHQWSFRESKLIWQQTRGSEPWPNRFLIIKVPGIPRNEMWKWKDGIFNQSKLTLPEINDANEYGEIAVDFDRFQQLVTPQEVNGN